MLEEFGTHLIKPALSAFNSLHATAPEFAVAEAAHISAPRNKLRPRKKDQKDAADASAPAGADAEEGTQASGGASAAAGAAGSAATDSAGPAASLGDPQDMAWMCVLWQRALQHPNAQVQRMGLRTFLQRAWGSSTGGAVEAGVHAAPRPHAAVPLEFVQAVLMPALTKEVHYKGTTSEFDTLVGRGALLCAPYCC